MDSIFFADALLADLQNTVPGSHLNSVNGAANGTSGYGLLKGARRKEPQVSVKPMNHASYVSSTLSRENCG